ncbi:MAG TPA: ABC transporter permease, partial [Candidatus Krumholzibacteria bacterium]|nr:ABC transporter permease [Candidatus Krumholzibacteria bacterium]
MFWSLIRKDLIRRWRSPASTLVMLLFPFMMAGMIGAISSGPSDQIPPTTLFVLDREDGLLGGFLTGGAVPEDSGFRLEVEKVGEEGFARMENGEASAMLVIPESFTEDLIEGRTTTLRLVRNPAESIKPEILEQGTYVIATYLDVAVKVLGEELEQMFDMFESDEMPSVLMVTQLSAAFYERISQAETYLFPPVVSIGSTKEEGAPRPNLFGYVLVMVSVMSVLFVAIRAVTDLYEDQRTGMLRRQLATPVPVAALVNAKVLFAVVFGVLVMLILLVAGALFGWFQEAVPVHWVLLHSVAFSLAAAGLMTMVVSV